jgi:quercetin dioxygenase-like cupin family protein
MSSIEPIFVGPGQTRHADGRSLVVADELQCKVRTSDLGGRLCIMLAEHAPWEGAPLHTHRDGDEWFYVTKGEFVYEVGGKLHRVVEGGSLVAPLGIPHRYINGPMPGTLIIGLTPGGRLEEFFEEGARRRRNPSPTPPTREELITFYAKYNVEYLGERLTAEDFKKASM